MTKIRTFLVGALLLTAFLATPQGQDSIIRLTGDGWLVAAGNRVPLLLGSDGKGFLKIDVDGAVTFINGATFTFPAGAFTGQLLGTASATIPPYSFSGDTNTGYGASAADTLALFAGGTTPRVTISSTLFTSTLPVLGPDGGLTTVGLGFASDPNTGLISSAADQLGVVVGGAFTNVFLANGLYGNLFVTSSGTLNFASGGFGSGADATFSRLAAGSVGLTAVGTATTSTDGFSQINSTAATVGATVQISRRLRLQGAGWDVDDAVSRAVSFFTEVLPVSGNTVAGTWRLGSIDPVSAAVTYPATLTDGGNFTILGSQVNSGGVQVGAAQRIRWAVSTVQIAPSNGLLNYLADSETVGIQVNIGTAAPAVSTCGTGAITANSRNVTGEFTATGATACTVDFGAPAWTNTPFCVVTLRNAPTTTPYISAISATAFTVSGLTANDVVAYHCIGRI